MTISREEREAKAAAQSVIRRIGKRERADAKKSRPVNPKADRGRVRDNVYLQWVRRLPCVATMRRTGASVFGVDAAHVRAAYPGWVNPGMSVKPDDWRAVPLCRGEHTRQHSGSEKAFWSELGIYPPDLCRALHDDFTAGGDGLAVLQQFATPTH